MRLNKNILGLILGPILFLVIMIFVDAEGLSFEAKCILASTAWMAIWWVTECVPISVTALLPIVLFPLTGGMDLATTTAAYGHKLVFLFVGGFLIALAIEKWHLHKRLALNIIRVTGSNKSRVILGFMLATAFLSMWMMNTSTTLMLLPIGISVATIAQQNIGKDINKNNGFATALMLGIAYSATIGGMTTLIGTAPNAVFASFIEENYEIQISFFNWLLVGLPLAILMLPLTWFILTKVIFVTNFSSNNEAVELSKQRYNNLGKMSVAEKRVLIVFGLTAFSWITRDLLQNIPGLQNLTDHVIAVVASVALFLLPSGNKDEKLMDWETAKNVPWNLLILFGGGLSLANAVSYSGLSVWLGGNLEPLGSFGLIILVIASVCLIVFLTELTSNLATTSVFLPVIASMAVGLGESPLILTASITLAASCAFMLPVATPPNLIVYGSNLFDINQMMRAGLALNIIGIILVSIIAVKLVPYFLG